MRDHRTKFNLIKYLLKSDDRVSVKLSHKGSYVVLISPIYRDITLCERIEHYTTRIDFDEDIYLTIISLALAGYEMIDCQRGAARLVCYNHLISNKRELNNCFI